MAWPKIISGAPTILARSSMPTCKTNAPLWHFKVLTEGCDEEEAYLLPIGAWLRLARITHAASVSSQRTDQKVPYNTDGLRNLLAPVAKYPLPPARGVVPAPVRTYPLRFANWTHRLHVLQTIRRLWWLGRMNLFNRHTLSPSIAT